MTAAITTIAEAPAATAVSAAVRLDFPAAADPWERAERLRREIAARAGAPVRLILPDGCYRWRTPLALGCENSGLELVAETPGGVCFDAGIPLRNWTEDSDGLWSCPVPEGVRECVFLYARDGRRERGRYPAQGFLPGRIVGNRLTGELDARLSVAGAAPDAELVVDYDWLCKHLKVNEIGADSLEFVPPVCPIPVEEVQFHLDNLPKGFLAPGQWSFERAIRRIFYRPRAGERPEEAGFHLGNLSCLLEVAGDPEAGKYVSDLGFDGIVFAHTGDPDFPESSQAEVMVSAALRWRGALDGYLRNCRIGHTSGWGMNFAEGCRRIAVENCRFEDLGAGGIAASGAVEEDAPGVTGELRIRRNRFHSGGRFFHGATAILLRHTPDNLVDGNEISRFHYSGISCGWVWGYSPSISQRNKIINNHIHHMGEACILRDGGAIYTLGPQPGAVIAGNIIHDIEGDLITWGIYLDEGSSDIVVENNLVYRVASECCRLHYGRRNLIRRNVFAEGGNAVVSLTRGTMDMDCRFEAGDNALKFEHNVYLTKPGKPFMIKYILDYEVQEDFSSVQSDDNILQSADGTLPPMVGEGYHMFRDDYIRLLALEEARECWEFDRRSYVAAPGDLLADPGAAERMSPVQRDLYRLYRKGGRP